MFLVPNENLARLFNRHGLLKIIVFFFVQICKYQNSTIKMVKKVVPLIIIMDFLQEEIKNEENNKIKTCFKITTRLFPPKLCFVSNDEIVTKKTNVAK